MQDDADLPTALLYAFEYSDINVPPASNWLIHPVSPDYEWSTCRSSPRAAEEATFQISSSVVLASELVPWSSLRSDRTWWLQNGTKIQLTHFRPSSGALVSLPPGQ